MIRLTGTERGRMEIRKGKNRGREGRCGLLDTVDAVGDGRVLAEARQRRLR
jgi:hypothetical protein